MAEDQTVVATQEYNELLRISTPLKGVLVEPFLVRSKNKCCAQQPSWNRGGDLAVFDCAERGDLAAAVGVRAHFRDQVHVRLGPVLRTELRLRGAGDVLRETTTP